MNKNLDLDRYKSKLISYGILLRPKHWVKNTFVLTPLLFTGEFISVGSILEALVAMLQFCLVSSAAYIVNDLHDIEEDRMHPLKSKQRPLASRQVSMFEAFVLLVFLFTLLALGALIQPDVSKVILSYFILSLAYTFVLKNQPVVDIFIIAVGFVLRVYGGAVALSVPLSSWMFITTLCLGLYLASIKRRQELLQRGASGRLVLKYYTISLTSRYAEMAATGALIFYSMFVITVRPEMIITIPIVLFGFFRYWYMVESLGHGESPTDALLSDIPLLLTITTWGVSCIWSLLAT